MDRRGDCSPPTASTGSGGGSLDASSLIIREPLGVLTTFVRVEPGVDLFGGVFLFGGVLAAGDCLCDAGVLLSLLLRELELFVFDGGLAGSWRSGGDQVRPSVGAGMMTTSPGVLSSSAGAVSAGGGAGCGCCGG
jgi:hypothetical protein